MKRNVFIELYLAVYASPCLCNVRFLHSAHCLSTPLLTVIPPTLFPSHTAPHCVPLPCHQYNFSSVKNVFSFSLYSPAACNNSYALQTGFSHFYLMLNVHCSLFLHLITYVRVSTLLEAAFSLSSYSTHFFLLNILVIGNTRLVSSPNL